MRAMRDLYLVFPSQSHSLSVVSLISLFLTYDTQVEARQSKVKVWVLLMVIGKINAGGWKRETKSFTPSVTSPSD